jgi:hypothetical protein
VLARAPQSRKSASLRAEAGELNLELVGEVRIDAGAGDRIAV